MAEETEKKPVQFNKGDWDAVHLYHDSNGKILFVIARKGTGDEKVIRPYYRDEDKNYYLGTPPGLEKYPIYHLSNFVQLYSLPQKIGPIVGEGEKVADYINALFDAPVCTTSPFGSKSAAKTDWKPVATAAKNGHTIYLAPDNDDPGYEYIATVANMILAINPDAKFKIVRVCDKEGVKKFDFADFLERRGVKPQWKK